MAKKSEAAPTQGLSEVDSSTQRNPKFIDKLRDLFRPMQELQYPTKRIVEVQLNGKVVDIIYYDYNAGIPDELNGYFLSNAYSKDVQYTFWYRTPTKAEEVLYFK